MKISGITCYLTNNQRLKKKIQLAVKNKINYSDTFCAKLPIIKKNKSMHARAAE